MPATASVMLLIGLFFVFFAVARKQILNTQGICFITSAVSTLAKSRLHFRVQMLLCIPLMFLCNFCFYR